MSDEKSGRDPGDATPVVALFVDPKGHYPGLVTEWFDEAKDARTYAGPHPVVAHPPCQLWVNFAALNFKRYGGEHNRPGNDGRCFDFAVRAVTQWAASSSTPGSRAWAAHWLPKPNGIGWTRHGRCEWVCEVWQSAYGHPARKRTWLFYSGEAPPAEGRWERPAGTHQVGWFDRIKPTLSKKEASRTPLAFAQWLIELAAGASPKEVRHVA